jgi:hypothetical protein
MDRTANTIQNNALARLAANAPQNVIRSIKQASARTGVNFAYLMQQAHVESSFKPAAKAKTSSASGLYQFIESTWLSMVKKYGDKHGLGDYADKISSNGRVSDRVTRKEILALRNNPDIASTLAAEYAGENKKFLDSHWGGVVGSTELYLAHFMGASGASSFLKARDENPMQKAALIFPEAAKSNRNVFYDTRTGRAKSLDEVYAFFDRKFEIEDGGETLIAENTPAPSPATRVQDYYSTMQSVVFNGGDFASRAFGSLYHKAPSALPGNLLANPVDVLLLSQSDEKNQYHF